MLHAVRRAWYRRRLKDQAYTFLFEDEPAEEVVSIDLETTGLDLKSDQILSVGAVRISGDRILTSQRLDFLVRPAEPVTDSAVVVHHIRPVDIKDAVPVEEAIRRVLDFVGPRPLLGYYLEFDAGMLDRHVRPLIGIPLPNRQIELSRLYYDWRAARLPAGSNIDLRFEAIRQQLDVPRRASHDAFNDALMTAMMYLRLRSGRRPTRG